MSNFIKKNISYIISIFILIGPIIDLLTGLCLHTLGIRFTIGIIFRVLFLISICLITLFVYKKKKVLIPYLLIGLYWILYIIGIILYKNTGLFSEIQNLVKVFYFPIMFISIYSLREEIRISNMTLFTTLFLYLIFIFIPLLFGIGYETYKITKAGTLGFYNSANEISGIISLLTPIMFVIIYKSKKLIPKILLAIMYLVVILMMGTKTPLLSLIVTLGASMLFFWNKSFKEKHFNRIIISVVALIIAITGMIIIIPKTNFYKNIETHLDFLEVDDIGDVFEDEKLVDHFIFSQRLTFLHRKAKLYHRANTYQKLFGIGYLRQNGRSTKMIEMDYFDIFYSHGIVGFLIFFIITIYIVYKIIRKRKEFSYERYMTDLSFLLIIVLSFFTGHIITAPAVSMIVTIIMLDLYRQDHKRILIVGDIKLSKKKLIVVKHEPIENNKIKLLIFKILNYKSFDYSYSPDKNNNLVEIASDNVLTKKEMQEL